MYPHLDNALPVLPPAYRNDKKRHDVCSRIAILYDLVKTYRQLSWKDMSPNNRKNLDDLIEKIREIGLAVYHEKGSLTLKTVRWLNLVHIMYYKY